MARLSTATADVGLAAMFVPSTGYFLGLWTTDPGTTGASGEVTGGSYAEQAIQFGSASAGAQASTDAQNFTGMPSATVDYFGIRATSGGTYMAGGQLSSSLTVPSGATVAFAIGAVTTALS